MAQYLTIRFDVTGLTARQIDALRGQVWPQGESNRKCVDDPADEYPDVKVAEVCHFCGAVVDDGDTSGIGDGECGGDGEGMCTESRCVTEYNPDGGTLDEVEAYVRWFCHREGIANEPVPYRNDGLTYYDQLAFLVREYHGMPHDKVTRRLP